MSLSRVWNENERFRLVFMLVFMPKTKNCGSLGNGQPTPLLFCSLANGLLIRGQKHYKELPVVFLQ
jgi:hypothetical protein